MHILVGFDGSEAACTAVRLAERHAIAWNAKLEIVNMIPEGRNLSSMDLIKAKAALKSRVSELLHSEELDYKCRVVIAIEAPGIELVKYARKYRSDEIIIGVGKKSKVGKYLFGSTAQHVILNSPCPVLTVK